jgi:Fic-DOC domain mobile mystery protein B
MGLELEYDRGQTPLNEEEMDGLLLPSVTTKKELDEFEQLNIQKAIEWYLIRKKFKADQILSEEFILGVHKKMLEDVWSWAGQFRTSEKTIGIAWYQVPIQLRQLIDDCNFWIKNGTYRPEEIAVRFKHQLVAIHLFSNGNGRHSRLMGDILMKHVLGMPRFSWGRNSSTGKSKIRDFYIKALKKADNGEFEDLIEIARS